MSITIRSKYTNKEYVPHSGQQLIHESSKRFRIMIAGRRWGKSLCGFMELLRFMVTHSNCFCLWVVPKFKELIPVSEIIREWLPFKIVRRHYQLQRTYRYIELKNGSKVRFESAEDPQGLRGLAIDFVILEEAAHLKSEVWYSILRPALLDKRGEALIISTPFGKNWLYQEYLRGQDSNPDYISWRRPTYDNPYIPKELIERDKETLPEDIFRQEYLAEFIEGAGTVFRNVRECFNKNIETYYEQFIVNRYSDGMRLLPKEQYKKFTFIGIDLGKIEDYSVFVALNNEGQLVGYERFKHLAWPMQRQRLKMFVEKFPRRHIVLDSRGPGDPIYDELVKEGIISEGVKLTLPLKREMIHNLVIKLDSLEITGPYIPELIEELEAFSYRLSSSGNVIYSAAETYHDDIVSALMMAAWHLKRKVTDWVSMSSKGFLNRRFKE